MKNHWIIIILIIVLMLVGCSTRDNTAVNTQSVTEQKITSNTEITEEIGQETTSNTKIEEVNDEKEGSNIEATEPVLETVIETEQTVSNITPQESADSGVIDYLLEVANNQDANSTMDAGVTYMFPKDDNGNRKLGGVLAYYSGLTGYEGSSDKKDFCMRYARDNLPEIIPFLTDAQVHDEDGFFGVVVTGTKWYVTLMPDSDYQGMTVIVSSVK